MKDVGMRIRIEPELRDQFVSLCRDNDTPAAQVLRAFMREFVKSNSLKNLNKPKNRQIDEKIIIRKQALD
jgi:hypothetical protein